jgi:DNA-directed RNA polymerase specialized sigma subunit
MTDPWIEALYKIEFNANPTEFLEKIKKLFTEDKKREERVIELLKRYENSEISVGKIAENLNIEREDVLRLMERHNIYLVDYDFEEDEKTIEKYLKR